ERTPGPSSAPRTIPVRATLPPPPMRPRVRTLPPPARKRDIRRIRGRGGHPPEPAAGAAPGLWNDALLGYPGRADQPAQRLHAAELVEPADQLRERLRLAGVRGGGRLLDRPGHLSVGPQVEHPRAGH